MTIKLDEVKTQEELDAALQALMDDRVNGLVAKNEELIGKLKKTKAETDEELERLRAADEKLKSIEQKSLEEQGEYKKLLDQTRSQHQEETERLRQELEATNTLVKTTLVNDGLARELAKHNVNPVLLEPAISILSNQVSVIEEDGRRIAKVGDKSLTEFVDDWSQSEVGKNFLLASNTGGGAGGNDDVGAGNGEYEKFFKKDTWNLTKQGELAKANPEMYEKLHSKYPSRNASGQ